MDQEAFERFCEIARSAAGIHLNDSKKPMVTARVAKRLCALHLCSEQGYLDVLEHDESGEELTHFLDVISTNFTSFYREKVHFDVLRQHVEQDWIPQRQEIRIWCAAASSGEEPYTIAFTVLEALRGTGLRFRLLATDISTRMLAAARAGEYHEERIAPVPAEQRRRFLRTVRSAGGERTCRVSDEVKQHVSFCRLNLNRPPYPMAGPFHAVFCRNVMIYFQNPTRAALVAEAERLLMPGGLFFTGHSETLAGLPTQLRVIRPSMYVLPAEARVAT